MRTTLVLGVGNTLVGDEGAGVHAALHLARVVGDRPDLEFLDGGTLGFTLRPDTREPEAFGIANINGPQVTDILEFGIFQETFDPDDEDNGVLDDNFDFLLYTFDNTGAPVGTVNAGFSSTTYLLDIALKALRGEGPDADQLATLIDAARRAA